MSTTDATSPYSKASAYQADSTSERIPNQTLGQDDFLKLLVAQLTSQDPLNPQKDTDFIAQMAQFSALEQNKSLAADISNLVERQQFSEAAGLLGRTVTVATATGTEQGVVTAVSIQNGIPGLLVNGNAYSVSQVLDVTETQIPQN